MNGPFGTCFMHLKSDIQIAIRVANKTKYLGIRKIPANVGPQKVANNGGIQIRRPEVCKIAGLEIALDYKSFGQHQLPLETLSNRISV